MKRGFLLPSPKKSRQSTTACRRPKALPTSTLPQCKDASKQQRRRIVNKSSDLLDLETDELDSSHLFQVVQDEGYSGEHDYSSSTIDEVPAVSPSDDIRHDRDHNSLLDDWVLSPSLRPLAIPSSSDKKHLSIRERNHIKNTRPLIVEVANSTTSDQRRNGDPTYKVDSNEPSADPFEINRDSGSKVKWNHSERNQDITEQCECRVIDDAPSKHTPEPQQQHLFREKDRLLFANELSLLLSRLRRCNKFNNKRRIQHKVVDFEGIFDGMYMSREAEIQVKEFIAKHFLTVHQDSEQTTLTQAEQGTRSELTLTVRSKLAELWSNLLCPIAQDYSANYSSPSQKKKKDIPTSSWTSPSLAVGLGIFVYSNHTALSYEYLETTLLDATKSSKNSWKVADKDNDATEKIEDIENKQKKIGALGAICLLRCWIRFIGVKLFQSEVKQESAFADSETIHDDVMTGMLDLYSKVEICLLKILPALEKLVSSDTRRTVLASASMDACFELVEVSARTTVLLQICQESASSSTPFVGDLEQLQISEHLLRWRDILSIIDKLLVAKQRWISVDNICDKSSNREQRGDHDSWVSTSKCLNVVLDDWKEVSKMSKRYFFDYVAGKDRCLDEVQLHDGANLAAGLTLIWNLAGIKVHRVRTHEDKSSAKAELTSRVGGIAQSLCQTQECTVGYATGSFYDCGGDADVADLVLSLQEAVHTTDKPPWIVKIHQRLAVRALASWLSKKRHFRGLLKTSKDNSELIEKISGVILSCLRLESKPCVDMSLAVLSMVWDLSPEWQSREARRDNSQSCLRHFSECLDALRMHLAVSSTEENSIQSGYTHLDSTTTALCVIVSRIASQNPEHLVPRVLEFSGPKEVILEVVINILEQLPTHTFVQKSAIEVLLESVDTLPYSTAKIQASHACFCKIPCNLVVPPILDFLAKKYSEKSLTSGVATISMLLRNVMIAKANEDQSIEFVQCVLGFYQSVDAPPAASSKDKTGLFSTFIEKNVSLWISALFDTKLSSDSAYSNMILAASRAIIDSPSNSTPLSLVSGLVRIEEDAPQTPDVRKRIYIATSRVLVFVVSESRNENHSTSHTSIFAAIAPLLVLRCIPRSFYRGVHEVLHVEANMKAIMVKLSRLVVEFIRVQALKNDKSDLAREERRLVAEVAGHCLPLSKRSVKDLVVDGEESFSLYDIICRDAFSAVVQILRKKSQLSHENMICRVVESKSALYAVCHYLPFADDNEEGTGLLDVACFAMEVLNHSHVTDTNGDDKSEELLAEEVGMLQSGCMNFLAVVFDSLSLRRTKNPVSCCQNTMVEEVDTSVRWNESENQRGCSILDALSRIFFHVKTIIVSGEIDRYCFFSTTEECREQEILTKNRRFSPSSRTAMLNSLVMLSRTSLGQDGSLEWMARNVLPLLVKWAHAGPADDSIHHPLCIAAGLQVVYTLLARVGSFDWIHSPGSTARAKGCAESDFARLTLKCALSSFETVEQNSSTIMSTLRLAAFKLMLTVIAIDKTSDSKLDYYLKPLEMQKAIKAVTFAANFDKHPDVRRMASDIVPRLVCFTTT